MERADNPLSRSRAGLIARSVVFAALVAWMFGGPFYVQVLEQHNRFTRYIRVWSMYSARGIGFVEARFFQVMPDGGRRDLDRFELLGFPEPRKAPGWLWRIPDRGTVHNIAMQLCAKLGPGADVRVIARRATTRGWRSEFRGTKKWCVARPSRDPNNGEPPSRP